MNNKIKSLLTKLSRQEQALEVHNFIIDNYNSLLVDIAKTINKKYKDARTFVIDGVIIKYTNDFTTSVIFNVIYDRNGQKDIAVELDCNIGESIKMKLINEREN